MQFTNFLLLSAAVFSEALAGPVALDSPELFPPEAGLLEARLPKCEYDIWAYKSSGCKGSNMYQGKYTSNTCIALQPSFRGSMIVKPLLSRCYPKNVAAFYKQFTADSCQGGVKFKVDFNGETCLDPSSSHPYDSMILNP